MESKSKKTAAPHAGKVAFREEVRANRRFWQRDVLIWVVVIILAALGGSYAYRHHGPARDEPPGPLDQIPRTQ